MKELKYAQDLIKSNNTNVEVGFNRFICGHHAPSPHGDYVAMAKGYDYAQTMAKEKGIAHIHNFGCDCGGHSFQYGGFFVCNGCGGKKVDKKWWRIQVEKDGNEYCCHGLDFKDLQSSNNYAFGKTYEKAINSYKEKMKTYKKTIK